MTSKHLMLDEAEIACALPFAELHDLLPALPINSRILDWGCGRGKSVLHLRDAGFDAWGVDVDPTVMAKAAKALEMRGLGDRRILCTVEEAAGFPAGHFHLVFSQETLEHIAPFDEVAREIFRLTAAGGHGIHSFPGSRQWIEPHLNVPLVHWLQSDAARRFLLDIALRLGAGPHPHWPEAVEVPPSGNPLTHARDVYLRYLREKVHYRSINEIAQQFRQAGFAVSDPILKTVSPSLPLVPIPRSWRDNGFPSGNLVLILKKP